jgi:hypothetical protein
MSSENDELEKKPQPAEETEGSEKTVAIGGGDQPEPEKKKEKKPGDWVTAQMSKAKRPETPPAAGSEWASAGSTPPATPTGPEKAPASFAPPPEVSGAVSSAQSGLNKLLSDIGIKDPNTQKTVLIVGGVALVLIACCACVCLGLVLTNTLQF